MDLRTEEFLPEYESFFADETIGDYEYDTNDFATSYDGWDINFDDQDRMSILPYLHTIHTQRKFVWWKLPRNSYQMRSQKPIQIVYEHLTILTSSMESILN